MILCVCVHWCPCLWLRVHMGARIQPWLWFLTNHPSCFCEKVFFSLIHGSPIRWCWLASESLGSAFLFLSSPGIRDPDCHSQLFMGVLGLTLGPHVCMVSTLTESRLTWFCTSITSAGTSYCFPAEPLLFSQQAGQNETRRLLATSRPAWGLPASCAGMDGPRSQQKPQCGSERVPGRGTVW